LVKCRAELAAFEAKGRSGTVEEEDEKVIAEALGVILKSAPAQEQPLARIRRHPSSTIHPPVADLGQRGSDWNYAAVPLAGPVIGGPGR